jgi:hypothetical protein
MTPENILQIDAHTDILVEQYKKQFVFITFAELCDNFYVSTEPQDYSNPIRIHPLPLNFLNATFPMKFIPRKQIYYKHYVPSSLGNLAPDLGYWDWDWRIEDEHIAFQTKKLQEIFHKMTNYYYWKNYNYLREFVNVHKMFWYEYWKEMPKYLEQTN